MRKAQRRTPDWSFWAHTAEVRIWEACALSLNLDPDSMVEPCDEDRRPRIDEAHFRNPDEKNCFDKRLRISREALRDRQYFSAGTINLADSNLRGVRLSEFARWASDVVKWQPLPEKFRSLSAPGSPLPSSIHAELAQGEKRRAARYTLEEAARTLERDAGERFETILPKLIRAARTGKLPMYDPGENARREYGLEKPVRHFYEEAFWDDLNAWLDAHEPRVKYRFSAPSHEHSAARPAASRGELSRPWVDEAKRLASEVWRDNRQFSRKKVLAQTHKKMLAGNVTGRGGRVPSLSTLERKLQNLKRP